jgi:membrane protease YdiL (CAAX protease family)
MTNENRTWINLPRRRSFFQWIVALAEVMVVFFFVPQLGQKLYRWTELPFADDFLFVADGEPDFVTAIPYELSYYAATFGLVVMATLLIGIVRRRTSPISYGLYREPGRFREVLRLGVFAGAAIYCIPNLLKVIDYYVADIGPGTAFWNLQAQVSWGWEYWLLMAVSGFLVIPVIEEFLVRGYLLGRLNENFRPGEAIIISAFLFSSAHLQYLKPDILSIGSSIGIVLNSMLLGYIVYRTGSILPVMIAHMIVNLPATPGWKVFGIATAVVCLGCFHRRVSKFVKEWLGMTRQGTDLKTIGIALVFVFITARAVTGKLPYADAWYGVCITLFVCSLLMRSTWKNGRVNTNMDSP